MRIKKKILIFTITTSIIFTLLPINAVNEEQLIEKKNITIPKLGNYDFTGFNLKTMTKGAIHGGVYISNGDFVGGSNYTNTHFLLPNGVAIWARLYLGVWGGSSSFIGVINTTVNGNHLGDVLINGESDTNPTYSQGTNVYGSGYGVWWISYNVTSQIIMGKQNNVSAYKKSGNIDGRFYNLVLVIVYENTSMPLIGYWINEGTISISSSNTNAITYFNGTINPNAIDYANLTILSSHGSDGQADALYFNQKENIGGPNQIGGNDFAEGNEGWHSDLDSFNVTGLLIQKDNFASFWYVEDSIRPIMAALVLEHEENPPIIDSPIDVYYQVGTTGNTITWNPYDQVPAYYVIYKNGTVYAKDTWNGSAITVNIDGLAVGIYNFTCFVNDSSGNWNSDEVIVHVTNDITINHPLDLIYYEGEKDKFICWNPSSISPKGYKIFRDGVLINESNSWDGSSITINVTDLPVKNYYNFTCWVNDTLGNSIKDEVNVTVLYDNIPPTITGPDDFGIEYGTTDQQLIIWNVDDINPKSFKISLNGTIKKEGAWNSSLEDIFINVSIAGRKLGTILIFNCTVIDKNNNNASDIVSITVVDTTKPTISNYPTIQIEKNQIVNVRWTGNDTFPMNYTIKLWPGYSVLEIGSWKSGVDIIYTFNSLYYNLDYDDYVYLICYLNDTSGNKVSDWTKILITDLISPILILKPLNITIEKGQEKSISWKAEDIHPDKYEIYINDNLLTSGTWDNLTEVSVDLKNLEVGIYIFKCKFYDKYGNTVESIVSVEIKSAKSTAEEQPEGLSIISYNLQILIISALGLIFILSRKRTIKGTLI
ncbi:MAG: DUF3344 domain-containing protein [Promethearchaeia archaeon]